MAFSDRWGKAVRISQETHRRLLIEAAMRGMKLCELADMAMKKGLDQLPPADPPAASLAQPS